MALPSLKNLHSIKVRILPIICPFIQTPFIMTPIFLELSLTNLMAKIPKARVTEMEHYLSLHGITNDLAKLCYGVLYLDPE
jgi:hypothetical protein